MNFQKIYKMSLLIHICMLLFIPLDYCNLIHELVKFNELYLEVLGVQTRHHKHANR
jgi:hypothetical protein